MPLSVMDLVRDILPKTNCGDCGFATCLVFASIGVSTMFLSERLRELLCKPPVEA